MRWVDIQNLAANDEPTEREKQQVIDFVRREAKPRFYADENFPESATTILRRLKADVLTVHDTRRRRHPDENHTAEALRLRRVLITCDRDYLNERRFPLIHCPALVVCNFGQGTAAEIRATFNCLSSIFCAPQFYDKWAKIDARPNYWIEYARNLDGTTSRRRYRTRDSRMQEWIDATKSA